MVTGSLPSNKMADISILDKERLKKLSRSSISDVTNVLLAPGPNLLKRIIKQDKNGGDIDPESLKEGQVSITFTNGNTYTGSINNGVLEGRGRFRWADGTVYEGEFINGCISGEGEYHWTNGSRYVGGVSDGYRHGNGTFYHSNGHNVYSGEWKRGIKTGKGKMFFNDKETSYYEGEWSNNQQNGFGTRRYESGDYYEGEWKESRRHGYGTMHWVTKGEKYTGQWREGVQNGDGEHIWSMMQTDNSQYPLCNRYNGKWLNGLRHGKGTFHYASGGQFEGIWYLNKKHGEGRYTLSNGHLVTGVYKEDKLVNTKIGASAAIEQDLSSSRPRTPLGSLIGDIDGPSSVGSTTQQFNMGVSSLLRQPISDHAHQLQKIHGVVLRYLTQLKRAYHLYSSLLMNTDEATAGSSWNVLKRIQLWQLFADCKLYRYKLTLTQVNSLMQKAIGGDSNEDALDLYTPFLMREYLQCIVFVAAHVTSSQTISLSQSLDEFIQNVFIPNVCQLKGLVFLYLPQTSIYLQQVLLLYQMFSSKWNATLRNYILFMKAHGVVNTDNYLSVEDIVTLLIQLHPLALNEGQYSLNIPMNFLEFFNTMIVCAVKLFNKVTATESDGNEEASLSDVTGRSPSGGDRPPKDSDSIAEDGKQSVDSTIRAESTENEEKQRLMDEEKKVAHPHVVFEDQIIPEGTRPCSTIDSNYGADTIDGQRSFQADEIIGSPPVCAEDISEALKQFLSLFKI